MDPQPYPLLHFLVRMKPTSTNVFLQVAKNVEVTRGNIWAVRRMLKCFPTKSLELIPYQIGSMGTGVIMQKVHRCGASGFMRACHAAGPGSIPGRDRFPM